MTTISQLDATIFSLTQHLARLSDWARLAALHAHLSATTAAVASARLRQEAAPHRQRLALLEKERSRLLSSLSLLARGMVWAARHQQWGTETRLERRLVALLGDAALPTAEELGMGDEGWRYVTAALRAGAAPRESCEVLIGEWLGERGRLVGALDGRRAA